MTALRRSAARIAVVSAAATISAAVIAAVVVVSDAPGSGSGTAFDACISQTRSLVLTHHRSGDKVIETIKDRAHSEVVGEFARLPSERAAEAFPTPVTGAAARNGRYVMFTNDLVGRDPTAVERCFDRVFPLDGA